MAHSTSMEDSIKKGWEITGDTNVWELVCKAVNHDTGEYHSTKRMRIGTGYLVQCDCLVNIMPGLVVDRELVVSLTFSRTTTFVPA